MHICFHWVLLTILATPPCNGEFEITFAFSHTLLWFSNLTQYAAIVAAFAPKPNHKLNLVHTFVQSSGIYQHFPIGSVGDKLETKMNTLRQEARIDALMRKFETLEGQLQQVMAEMKDEIQTIGNETNMVHDYAAGLHYSIVENGDFLRNGLGLTHQQWVHLTTLERANMVAARVMGSVDYMRAIRQRYGTYGQADETDAIPMEAEDTATSPSSAETITGLLGFR